MRSSAWPRILAEQLVPLSEPLAALVRPGQPASPASVVRLAAEALLELPPWTADRWPAWLAPHQQPAAERVSAILGRYCGAVLADAAGLGKSYVALAVAVVHSGRTTLVVPAVLVSQWRSLLDRLHVTARIVTHESLSSRRMPSPDAGPADARPLVIVDEAHRFRNADTQRYRRLARLVVGCRVLCVTATPVHNRVGDIVQLLRLFLRDDALVSLGVPSLARVARGEGDRSLTASVVARLVVARSRAAVRRRYRGSAFGLSFPTRIQGRTVRVATAPRPELDDLVEAIRALPGGDAGALLRLTLLRRLASSCVALTATLARHEALLQLAATAAAEGRTLTAREFRRVFPRRLEGDLQLVLFPILLAPGAPGAALPDPESVARIRAVAAGLADPKADALAALLAERPGKTIVFTDAIATARLLVRLLARRLRVAAVLGGSGLLGVARAGRADVLRTFAPLTHGAVPPREALEIDVLIATDLLSEGLDLHDAARVVHYDLPWSPARLEQRVGRIDRMGSPHSSVETVTFVPAEPLAAALGIERRLIAKARVQAAAGAAEVTSPSGRAEWGGMLDWCDRLHVLSRTPGSAADRGSWVAVSGPPETAVLVVRIGAYAESIVVRGRLAVSDPRGAAELLEPVPASEVREASAELVRAAIAKAAPLIRSRLAAVAASRWRSSDRHGRARRLIPWVLTAAREAAGRRDAARLRALDALVSTLSSGLTAGEELSLDDLLGRPGPIDVDHLLAWQRAIAPRADHEVSTAAELVAAVVFLPPESSHSPMPPPARRVATG